MIFSNTHYAKYSKSGRKTLQRRDAGEHSSKNQLVDPSSEEKIVRGWFIYEFQGMKKELRYMLTETWWEWLAARVQEKEEQDIGRGTAEAG